MANFDGKEGMWALYNTGNVCGYEATRLYETQIDAIIGAQYNWPDRIFFWPIGLHVVEAVMWWERKCRDLVNATEEAEPGPHT